MIVARAFLEFLTMICGIATGSVVYVISADAEVVCACWRYFFSKTKEASPSFASERV